MLNKSSAVKIMTLATIIMNYKCIAFKSVLTTIVVICLISPCSCDNSDNTLNNTTTASLNLTNNFETSSSNNNKINNNHNNNINNNINNNNNNINNNNHNNNKISSKTTVTVNSNDNGAQPIITTDTNTQHQIPLVRLPSNTLLKYTAYKDVSIQHFRIPIDTRSAYFSFKSYEEGKSAFARVCQPQDVTLHLKAGSYPVISPENITFPKHFLSADQRFEIHSLNFKSDGVTRRLTIDGPHPGNWFGVAFISWSDPNNERIEQQGLSASCETLLLSEMAIVRAHPKIITPNASYKDTIATNATEPRSYKFFVPRNVDICTWRLTIVRTCNDCTDLSFFVQSHSLPNHKNYLQNAIVNVTQANETIIDFYPHENAWHYVDLDFLVGETIKSSITNSNMSQAQTTPTPINKTSTTTTTATTVNNQPVHHVEFSVSLEFHYFNSDDENEIDTNRNNNNDNYNNNDNDDDDDEMTEDINNNNNNNNKSQKNTGHEKYIPAIIKSRGFRNYPLLRQTYREFFMFDYDLLPDVNGTVPLSINMTAGVTTLMKFDVGDVYDIGGTLSFAIAMKYDISGNVIDSTPTHANSDEGVEQAYAEKLVSEESNKFRSNQTVIVCMRLNEPGIPTWPDKCVYGRQIFPASSVINNTDADSGTGLIHVPFPESGIWYVTLGLFCHGSGAAMETTGAARATVNNSIKNFIKHNVDLLKTFQAPCSCAAEMNLTQYRDCLANDKCLNAMNEKDAIKIKECLMDSKCTSNEHLELSKAFDIHHKQATEQSVAAGSNYGSSYDGSCNTSVVFTISSSPCVAGRCGRNGRCYHYMSGGFVFSTCLCLKFYRGWDCTEDSQVPSSVSILVASLLLTLSNLLFIPSIYFAVRREYYTEAVIYFFAMFFSTFYHACDSGEEEFSFCLVKISVLQFCDFYCGLLAIWVTLIAMANVRPTFVSLLHMLGAILLAFGTELNKQSLWVFLAPALTGICIISVSWGLKCRKTKKWYPSRRYLAIFLPLGSVLVMVGLVCYAFLQTKQNYHIVHSIWHMVMALSILCLLPNRKTFKPKC